MAELCGGENCGTVTLRGPRAVFCVRVGAVGRALWVVVRLGARAAGACEVVAGTIEDGVRVRAGRADMRPPSMKPVKLHVLHSPAVHP